MPGNPQVTMPACAWHLLTTALSAAEKLTEEEARAMLQDLQLAAPADEGPLVGLLSRWAARGRQESPEPQVRLHTIFLFLHFAEVGDLYVTIPLEWHLPSRKSHG